MKCSKKIAERQILSMFFEINRSLTKLKKDSLAGVDFPQGLGGGAF
jgi:hypothetical protein